MIALEGLKKGDHVLVVSNDWLSSSRDSERCTEVVVTSLGKKYIGVQSIQLDGTLSGRTEKFYNDERCGRVDWGQWRLFLGTKEEWLEAKEKRLALEEKQASVRRREMQERSVEELYDQAQSMSESSNMYVRRLANNLIGLLDEKYERKYPTG